MTSRFRIRSFVSCASIVISLNSSGTVINWDSGGADTLWSTPENWSDDAAPTAGNDYVVDAATFRSPDTTNTTFGGDSLTIQNGAILNLYRTNGGGYFNVTHSIPSLSVSNAEIRPQSSVGSIGHTLSGPLELLGTNTLNMNENSAYTMRMFFTGAISGNGNLQVTRDTTGSTRSFEFSGDTSAYSGDVSFAGVGSSDTMILDVSNASGWGSGELTVGNFGILNLNTGITSPSATIFLSTTGTSLNLNGLSTVGSLTIGGTPISLGTYDAASLTDLALGGTFGGTGTITVVPETSVAFLASLSALMLLRRRRP